MPCVTVQTDLMHVGRPFDTLSIVSKIVAVLFLHGLGFRFYAVLSVSNIAPS